MKVDDQINEILNRVGAGMSTWEDAMVLRGYIIGLVGRIKALEGLFDQVFDSLPRATHIEDHGF